MSLFANVNIGSSASDGTGDPLRVAFNKINLNFSNIAVGNVAAANISYTMGNSSNWVYAVSSVSAALDQLATQSNTAQTTAYLTTYSGNIRAGNFTVSGTSQLGIARFNTYTVSTLPSASSIGPGARLFVTDANITTSSVGTAISAVSGGFANTLPVYSDGTTWRIG
jgi:hypothetical protein